MYNVLQYELNCKFSYPLFKQEKHRLIGSFHLKKKNRSIFNIIRQQNLSNSKFGYYRSLTNNLMKYIFVKKYN